MKQNVFAAKALKKSDYWTSKSLAMQTEAVCWSARPLLTASAPSAAAERIFYLF